MCQILDTAATSKDSDDEEEEDDEDDDEDEDDEGAEEPISEVSVEHDGGDSQYFGLDGDEADDVEMLRQPLFGGEAARRGSTGRPANATEAEKSEAAYLHKLASALDDSLGCSYGGALIVIDWLLPSFSADGQLPTNIVSTKAADLTHTPTTAATFATAADLTPHISDLGHGAFDSSADSVEVSSVAAQCRRAMETSGATQYRPANRQSTFELACSRANSMTAEVVACYLLKELLAI
ncbi:hypothetical protein T492DRAFT_911343 [Pavlovales sp. CCMP2436]|nr:hypothetical protein T492DRAFT_911343 [Pavlovales sp. CCMP2436]